MKSGRVPANFCLVCADFSSKIHALILCGQALKNSAEKLIVGNYNISHIFSGVLPRARETAEIIADRLNAEMRLMGEFREINNGSLAGMPKEQVRSQYPGIYYSALEWGQAYPNGESPKLFYK